MEASVPTLWCGQPSGSSAPVPRPLPGSSRRERPARPPARPRPAHTHGDTGATILLCGRSGRGLLGLHRATAATSGNRGEEAPTASAGWGYRLGRGGGPHPGLTWPRPPAARCPSGARLSRVSPLAAPAACAGDPGGTEVRPQEECSPRREGQESFIHHRYSSIPRGAHTGESSQVRAHRWSAVNGGGSSLASAWRLPRK